MLPNVLRPWIRVTVVYVCSLRVDFMDDSIFFFPFEKSSMIAARCFGELGLAIAAIATWACDTWALGVASATTVPEEVGIPVKLIVACLSIPVLLPMLALARFSTVLGLLSQ